MKFTTVPQFDALYHNKAKNGMPSYDIFRNLLHQVLMPLPLDLLQPIVKSTDNNNDNNNDNNAKVQASNLSNIDEQPKLADVLKTDIASTTKKTKEEASSDRLNIIRSMNKASIFFETLAMMSLYRNSDKDAIFVQKLARLITFYTHTGYHADSIWNEVMQYLIEDEKIPGNKETHRAEYFVPLNLRTRQPILMQNKPNIPENNILHFLSEQASPYNLTEYKKRYLVTNFDGMMLSLLCYLSPYDILYTISYTAYDIKTIQMSAKKKFEDVLKNINVNNKVAITQWRHVEEYLNKESDPRTPHEKLITYFDTEAPMLYCPSTYVLFHHKLFSALVFDIHTHFRLKHKPCEYEATWPNWIDETKRFASIILFLMSFIANTPLEQSTQSNIAKEAINIVSSSPYSIIQNYDVSTAQVRNTDIILLRHLYIFLTEMKDDQQIKDEFSKLADTLERMKHNTGNPTETKIIYRDELNSLVASTIVDDIVFNYSMALSACGLNAVVPYVTIMTNKGEQGWLSYHRYSNYKVFTNSMVESPSAIPTKDIIRTYPNGDLIPTTLIELKDLGKYANSIIRVKCFKDYMEFTTIEYLYLPYALYATVLSLSGNVSDATRKLNNYIDSEYRPHLSYQYRDLFSRNIVEKDSTRDKLYQNYVSSYTKTLSNNNIISGILKYQIFLDNFTGLDFPSSPQGNLIYTLYPNAVAYLNISNHLPNSSFIEMGVRDKLNEVKSKNEFDPEKLAYMRPFNIVKFFEQYCQLEQDPRMITPLITVVAGETMYTGCPAAPMGQMKLPNYTKPFFPLQNDKGVLEFDKELPTIAKLSDGYKALAGLVDMYKCGTYFVQPGKENDDIVKFLVETDEELCFPIGLMVGSSGAGKSTAIGALLYSLLTLSSEVMINGKYTEMCRIAERVTSKFSAENASPDARWSITPEYKSSALGTSKPELEYQKKLYDFADDLKTGKLGYRVVILFHRSILYYGFKESKVRKSKEMALENLNSSRSILIHQGGMLDKRLIKTATVELPKPIREYLDSIADPEKKAEQRKNFVNAFNEKSCTKRLRLLCANLVIAESIDKLEAQIAGFSKAKVATIPNAKHTTDATTIDNISKYLSKNGNKEPNSKAPEKIGEYLVLPRDKYLSYLGSDHPDSFTKDTIDSNNPYYEMYNFDPRPTSNGKKPEGEKPQVLTLFNQEGAYRDKLARVFTNRLRDENETSLKKFLTTSIPKFALVDTMGIEDIHTTYGVDHVINSFLLYANYRDIGLDENKASDILFRDFYVNDNFFLRDNGQSIQQGIVTNNELIYKDIDIKSNSYEKLRELSNKPIFTSNLTNNERAAYVSSIRDRTIEIWEGLYELKMLIALSSVGEGRTIRSTNNAFADVVHIDYNNLKLFANRLFSKVSDVHSIRYILNTLERASNKQNIVLNTSMFLGPNNKERDVLILKLIQMSSYQFSVHVKGLPITTFNASTKLDPNHMPYNDTAIVPSSTSIKNTTYVRQPTSFFFIPSSECLKRSGFSNGDFLELYINGITYDQYKTVDNYIRKATTASYEELPEE